MTLSQSSDFSCNTPPLSDTLPALFTRMLRLPSLLSTLLSAGSNPARLVTSTLKAIEGTPIAFSSESTRWFFSSFRPNTATAAPASANPSAMLRPIPPLPPVTTATRPVRSNNAGVFIQYSPYRVFRVAAQLLFSRNLRFGPLARASYASPALDTTNLPPEQAPARSVGFRRAKVAYRKAMSLAFPTRSAQREPAGFANARRNHIMTKQK